MPGRSGDAIPMAPPTAMGLCLWSCVSNSLGWYTGAYIVDRPEPSRSRDTCHTSALSWMAVPPLAQIPCCATRDERMCGFVDRNASPLRRPRPLRHSALLHAAYRFMVGDRSTDQVGYPMCAALHDHILAEPLSPALSAGSLRQMRVQLDGATGTEMPGMWHSVRSTNVTLHSSLFDNGEARSAAGGMAKRSAAMR